MSETENKRAIGMKKEIRASEYLKNLGFEILATNFRNRYGEVDIIAREKETLCFVEVKYRSSLQCGYAAEAVDRRKQKRICRVARYYLMKQGADEWTPCRFDVVALDGEQISLIRNAFEYC